jgi:hypothetical protein
MAERWGDKEKVEETGLKQASKRSTIKTIRA